MHPSLSQCLELLEQVHRRSFGTNYALLITGLSGTGKSYLGKTYQNKFPPYDTPELRVHPVVYVKLTETRTASDLLLQIVKAFTNVLGNNVNKAHLVQDRLAVLLHEHQVELVIIDEIQECLTDIDGITSQRMAKQIASLIDNNPSVSLLMLGTPLASRLLRLKYGKSAERLKGEEQLSRRFLAEHHLNIIPSRCECWLDCCNYFAKQHGLPDFSLADKAILNRLHLATEGKIGLLNKLFSICTSLKQESLTERMGNAYLTAINSSAFNPFDAETFDDEEIKRLLDAREFG